MSMSTPTVPTTAATGKPRRTSTATATATAPSGVESVRTGPGVETAGAEGEAVWWRSRGVIYPEAGIGSVLGLGDDEVPERGVGRGRPVVEGGRTGRAWGRVGEGHFVMSCDGVEVSCC